MKLFLKNIFFLFISVSLFWGCAHRPNPQDLELIPEAEFHKIYETYTRRVQKYEGLYNTIDATATLRNTMVMRAQLDHKARLQQWDKSQYQLELNKLNEKMKNESEIFVSFYTPDRKNDDLNKFGTQWKIYLESEGRRWEGKVSKTKGQTAEIQGLFKEHTRFATPYSITFPIQTSALDGAKNKLIITGPLGLAEFEFSPELVAK